MSHMVGADVAELRDLASSFNARAAQLKSIEAGMTWRIHSAPWQGDDVSRFVHDWNVKHRRVIVAAAASISSAAQDLMAHATQQEQASSAGFTGSVGSVAALRAQEAQRVGAAAGSSTPMQSSGLSLLGLLKGIKGSVKVATKVAEKYLEFARKAVLRDRAIAQFGEKRAEELLRHVPAVLSRNNEVYRALKVVDGRVLGPIGVVLDVLSTGEAISQHKYDDAVISGVSAGLGAAATLVAFGAITGPAAPIILGAGVVWMVGSMAYQHREALGKAATWISDRAADRLRNFDEVAKNGLVSAARATDQAVDTAKGFVRNVTSPLRSIFG